MFCPNCGATTEDNAKFCPSCGNKLFLEEEAVEDIKMDDIFEPVITKTDESEAEATVSEAEATKGTGGRQIVLSKKLKLYIAGAAAAGIMITATLGFALKNSIFFAVSPEKYTGNLIANTLEEMAEESDKVSENLMGFSIDDEFTAGAKVEYKEDYDHGTSVTADFKLSSEEDEEMMIDMSLKGKQEGENISAGLQGFWNNEKIGIAVDNVKLGDKALLPKEAADKYFTVSSRNFGDDFMNSIFAGSEYGIDNLDISGLDLSYENVTEMLKGEELKPVKKKIKKKFLILLENSQISKRKKTEFKLGDDTVKAKNITVTLNSEAMLDFTISSLEIIRDDKYIRKQFGLGTISQLDLIINELKGERSDVAYAEIDLDLIEYDGKLAQLSLIYGGNGVLISRTDKKALLNGMKFDVLSNGTPDLRFEYSSNWVNENKDIFFNAGALQHGSTVLNLSARFDYKENRFNATASIPGVDTRSVKGKCSKKGGFTLEFDDIKFEQSGSVKTNSMDFDEWFEEKYLNNSEKANSYYTDNDKYDELWDIYYDEYWSDYDSYADWYDAMGKNYDEGYKDYEKWLKDELYNAEETRDSYDYETADYDYIDYNTSIKITFTLKDKAGIKIKDRKHIDLFKLSEKDFEEMIQAFENFNELGD